VLRRRAYFSLPFAESCKTPLNLFLALAPPARHRCTTVFQEGMVSCGEGSLYELRSNWVVKNEDSLPP
jgi:hypothetical protein